MEKRARLFEFTSYSFEPQKKRILFNYKTTFRNGESMHFTEIIVLPKIPDIAKIPKGLLEKMLEGLHIALGVSYYKFYCATKVVLPYRLSKEDASFWTTVYRKGLGEFFYRNKLNPNISPKFTYDARVKSASYPLPRNNRCLVAIGGGKDSIVSAELLKEGNFDATTFFIQTGGKTALIDELVGLIGRPHLAVQRILDDKVHLQHAYNGHIPISAIYAFLGTFVSVLYGYQYLIVSNEHSSNFGNVRYKGEEINHQWSKSFEFETLFQQYLGRNISRDVSYFSLLRSFYEIRIVKLFSRYKKYFHAFSSCNRNFKLQNPGEGLWCGVCAKCVFAFLLLSAFLGRQELVRIFKKNLYQDSNLLPLFKDVLGFGKMKPFDCVGTFEEAQAALYLAKNRFGGDVIVNKLLPKVKFPEKKLSETLRTNREVSIPDKFRLLGMENVLILGYGREGKITEAYLKKYHPKLKIGIADASLGKEYLNKQRDFDIAIKTPGMKKELVEIPYTTATNIFLSKIAEKNTVVGITGSKGKSTTSSLIFAMLKEAGKKVTFLGNIGKPMLERLLEPIEKKEIFVLELSSYQLDDASISPHIAVVTNLFPEHMDYHGGAENYYNAKKRIIDFQGTSDYFVYDPKNPKVSAWLKGYHGIAVPFAKTIPLSDKEIPLAGEHNKNNVRAAIAAAKLLGVKDPAIRRAIKTFKSLPHRLEFVGKYHDILFYDDGSSTNPESAILAVRALPDIDTIFLGGEERGFDFSELAKAMKSRGIKNAVLFPETGESILKALKRSYGKKPLHFLKTKSMEEAVRFAYQHTREGHICLLSGASPSYTLWKKGFEEKGAEFQKFVTSLGIRNIHR